MQTRSKKNNIVVSVNPVRNIVTRSQTSGIKMTIVDDEDYDDDAEDCDDDEELNNIHKMKTRSKTSGKRQMFIDDDFVYNDDACDADWE